jgi:hypothetical protein
MKKDSTGVRISKSAGRNEVRIRVSELKRGVQV